MENTIRITPLALIRLHNTTTTNFEQFKIDLGRESSLIIDTKKESIVFFDIHRTETTVFLTEWTIGSLKKLYKTLAGYDLIERLDVPLKRLLLLYLGFDEIEGANTFQLPLNKELTITVSLNTGLSQVQKYLNNSDKLAPILAFEPHLDALINIYHTFTNLDLVEQLLFIKIQQFLFQNHFHHLEHYKDAWVYSLDEDKKYFINYSELENTFNLISIVDRNIITHNTISIGNDIKKTFDEFKIQSVNFILKYLTPTEENDK